MVLNRTILYTVRNRTNQRGAYFMDRDKINKIYNAVKKVDRAYEIWAAKHGLTLYELQIYYVIVENGGGAITQKDLCTQLDAPKTSINSIIKKQLLAGRIEMEVNPRNKREKIIALTDEGKKFAEELIFRLFKCENDAVLSIAENDVDIAIDVQTKFADNLLKEVG